jgi:hypothetical protein
MDFPLAEGHEAGNHGAGARAEPAPTYFGATISIPLFVTWFAFDLGTYRGGSAVTCRRRLLLLPHSDAIIGDIDNSKAVVQFVSGANDARVDNRGCASSVVIECLYPIIWNSVCLPASC